MGSIPTAGSPSPPDYMCHALLSESFAAAEADANGCGTDGHDNVPGVHQTLHTLCPETTRARQ